MASATEPGWYLVPSHVAGEYFPMAEKMIMDAFAVDPHKFTAKDVLHLIVQGDWALWLAMRDGIQSAMIIELIKYPTNRIGAWVRAAGGQDPKYWLGEPFARVAQWARDNKADFIEAEGREGWARILGPEWQRRAAFRMEL